MSPLLFVLPLEILLIKICDSGKIWGIQIRDQDYRLRAFADDLVVTVTQPDYSVVELMEIIMLYGKVSGFKINIQKTKILSKNMTVSQKAVLEELTGFEIQGVQNY